MPHRNSIQLKDLLIRLVVIELILGGSGYLFNVAGISLRQILFALVCLSLVITAYKNKIVIDRKDDVLILFLMYIVLELLISFMRSNDGKNALDSFAGYLPYILCLFFEMYFRRIDQKKFNSIIHLIENLTLAISFVACLIWVFCLINGPSVYFLVQGEWLDRFNFGSLAYIGVIPRLVLKGCLFSIVGFFLTMRRVVDKIQKKTYLLSVKLVIYVLSILLTFSLGWYLATTIGFFVLMIKGSNKRNRNRLLLALLSVLVLVPAIASLLDVSAVIQERFSGDYSTSYKVTQALALLKEWLGAPLFGKGFGYTMSIDYSYELRESYQFEVMWLELLMNTGIIGFGLLATHLILTLKKLFLRYERYADTVSFCFAIWC